MAPTGTKLLRLLKRRSERKRVGGLGGPPLSVRTSLTVYVRSGVEPQKYVMPALGVGGWAGRNQGRAAGTEVEQQKCVRQAGGVKHVCQAWSGTHHRGPNPCMHACEKPSPTHH